MRDGPAYSRKQSKVVEVVRVQWKIVGCFPSFACNHPSIPTTTRIPSLGLGVTLSVSLVPVDSVGSLSRFLLPLCLAPSGCLPLSFPSSLSVSVSLSCSFSSFLTSNHLGPRTSAVSRSFLAAAFRHFPPDRARAVRQTPFCSSRLIVTSPR
ncbi:unnamed protein product [Xylocopa violacea]|uniref:Transmembrane protein n=1 Tax=Xylocopa violacea TaxID=135666 RepID=A0ABP1NE02_XYLVO